VPTKLVRLIKLHLNEACSEVRVGKYLSDSFPIRNGIKQGIVACVYKATVEFYYL
jgi:hypothetical protein